MLRRARPEDEEAIRRCAEAAYQPYIATIGKKPAPMIADFAGQIAKDCVYLATRGDRIDGFIVFFPRGTDMFLENVAVLPAHAGRGLGKVLIGFCEAEARRLGLRAVRLYTNEKMTGNLRLYPHLGYVEIARRREDGFNRVYFEKRLT